MHAKPNTYPSMTRILAAAARCATTQATPVLPSALLGIPPNNNHLLWQMAMIWYANDVFVPHEVIARKLHITTEFIEHRIFFYREMSNDESYRTVVNRADAIRSELLRFAKAGLRYARV